MKKTVLSMIALLCVILSIQVFASCNQSPQNSDEISQSEQTSELTEQPSTQEQQSTTEEQSTQAPEEQTTQQGQLIVPEEGQIWLVSTYINHAEQNKGKHSYNEYGNLIRNENYDLYGNFRAAWTYEYDEHQNLTKRTVDTGDGSPFVQLINTYDENGNLIKAQEFTYPVGETVYTYTYDQQNRVTSKSANGRLTHTYTYAEDGSYRMQSESDSACYTLYDKHGNMLEQHLSETLVTICTYRENGQMAEWLSYNGGELQVRYVYEHDAYGNHIRTLSVRNPEKPYVVSEYTYELFSVKALPES